MKKIGIIICDRYSNCAGGKCFRAMKNHDGAFSIYGDNTDLEIAGYTTCGGCPGGNIEYAPTEMIKNGVEVIHFATGFVVGYPPCPYINNFKSFTATHWHYNTFVTNKDPEWRIKIMINFTLNSSGKVNVLDFEGLKFIKTKG